MVPRWSLATLTLISSTAAGCAIERTPFTSIPPQAHVVEVTTPVADATYGTGAQIPIRVRFDRVVDVTGTPRLRLDSGAPPVANTGGTGTDTLEFLYTVTTGELALALDYADAAALVLDDPMLPATIQSAGVDADLTLPPPGGAGSLAGGRQIAISTGTRTFAYTGTVETLTVPVGVTSMRIVALGAEGGTSTGEAGGMTIRGGKGAQVSATVPVSGGVVLSILVGGIGLNSNCGSGGGGGSWVVRPGAPLAVAGGGGGGFHCNALGASLGGDGAAVPDGGAGICSPQRTSTAGGKAGNGGVSYYGGGGGGWLTAGAQMANMMAGGGGAYPGAGGAPNGGFGGGGGNFSSCCGGSGGGGGYSGGSGGTSDGCAGGGGGSFAAPAATDVTLAAGARTGAGQITITW